MYKTRLESSDSEVNDKSSDSEGLLKDKLVLLALKGSRKRLAEFSKKRRENHGDFRLRESCAELR